MDWQKHLLHISGMHCKACVFMIKDIIIQVEWVHGSTIHLHKEIIEIYHADCDLNTEELISLLNPVLAGSWYGLYLEKPLRQINRTEYALAFLIAAILLFGFYKLQNTNLLDFIYSEKRTYGTSFLIGLIASVSSCLAVIWWIVLALWTVVAKETKSLLPQRLFHVGRLWWFFILWGLLGYLGSSFQLSPTFSTILNIVIWIIMLLLGLNLLGVIKSSFALEWWVFRWFSSQWWLTRWPLLIGIGTFFAPCGFTQSMQLYALSTWSFMSGWLTMLSFAVGTFPVLFFLSITGKTIQQSSNSGLFFKTIGVILIALALFNMMNSLTILGIGIN